MNKGSDGQTEKSLVTPERVIHAKKLWGQCQCHGQYCGHIDRCGQPLGEGWKIRLSPPQVEFGDPMELTAEEFDFLLRSTVALMWGLAHSPGLNR